MMYTNLSIILDSKLHRVNNSGMYDVSPSTDPSRHAVVIGAGVGGLATALRLRAGGMMVTLIEAHDWVGGKMRVVSSAAGPVDAGPTVLTMRHVFDDLFATTGASLDDHVTLVPEPLLARHFWQDGSTLDLTADTKKNTKAIAAFSNETAASEFLTFSQEARQLFALFDAPMMQSADPKLIKLASVVIGSPQHMRTLSPLATLAKLLRRRFSDARLRQLFGRYATYVGGSPIQSPALLALIWQAEAAGVWRVDGGMHQLAKALRDRFLAMGGQLMTGTHVRAIDVGVEGVCGVVTEAGKSVKAETVVFCGDPRALALGQLGPDVAHVATDTEYAERSLSARVWSFAATAKTSLRLAHHNVFFGRDPYDEFDDLAGGAIPTDPTIYVCAQDRGNEAAAPTGQERFEIILNAAPLTLADSRPNEEEICRQTTFQTLERFGLAFAPMPTSDALSTPTTFEKLFPGSAGSLYGQSPHGMTAALKRPRARTAVKGLYLAGGGTHPGAGVPMAALSGKHAAEAIVTDLALI